MNYRKELEKLFKLIKNYWIKKKMTKKELNSNFSFTKEGIKQACYKKNSDEIAYLMYSIGIFGLFPKYSLNFVNSFSELSREEFHEEHEDIASYFQSLHLP